MAVENDNLEIVKLLLEKDNIDIISPFIFHYIFIYKI